MLGYLRVYNKITRKCPGKVQVFKDFLKFGQGSINKGHPIFEQDTVWTVNDSLCDF